MKIGDKVRIVKPPLVDHYLFMLAEMMEDPTALQDRIACEALVGKTGVVIGIADEEAPRTILVDIEAPIDSDYIRFCRSRAIEAFRTEGIEVQESTYTPITFQEDQVCVL